MSVEATIYCGVFVNILDHIEDPYSEEYLPFIEGWKDEKFLMIHDRMDGDYCYFGISLAEIKELYGNEFHEIDVRLISEFSYDVKNKLEELGIECDEEPKLILFNHCD